MGSLSVTVGNGLASDHLWVAGSSTRPLPGPLGTPKRRTSKWIKNLNLKVRMTSSAGTRTRARLSGRLSRSCKRDVSFWCLCNDLRLVRMNKSPLPSHDKPPPPMHRFRKLVGPLNRNQERATELSRFPPAVPPGSRTGDFGSVNVGCYSMCLYDQGRRSAWGAERPPSQVFSSQSLVQPPFLE